MKIFLLVVLGTAQAFVDVPFSQWNSTRYTSSDAESIADWPSLAANPSQIAITDEDATVFMMAADSLTCCVSASDLTSSGCSTIKVPGSELLKMVVNSDTASATVAISHTDGLSIVRCGVGCTACSVVSRITAAQGLGSVHSMLWKDDIWVASDTGLFAYRYEASRLSITMSGFDPCSQKNTSRVVYGLALMDGLLAEGAVNLLVASTNTCIAFLNTSTISKVKVVRRQWNGGLVDGIARCLAFSSTSQTLWAASNVSLNSFSVLSDVDSATCGASIGAAGVWDRVPRGLNGLPYASCPGGACQWPADAGL
jgi:hypothetical protein